MCSPADPNPGVHGKTGEGCFEQIFIAGRVLGAFVGMQDVPEAYNRVLPASYGGNYLLMPGYDTAALGGAGNATKGRNMTALASPSNIFFSTEVGSVFVPTYVTYFSGWYTFPGYATLAPTSIAGLWEHVTPAAANRPSPMATPSTLRILPSRPLQVDSRAFESWSSNISREASGLTGKPQAATTVSSLSRKPAAPDNRT